MKLIIENFGPIKNNIQAIDLCKDFFVFVGYNNSGKSYVSQLLWTILNEDIIHKFATNNIDIIKDNFEENTNIIKVDRSFINKILKKYSVFLEEEVKKNTFNIRFQNSNLNNVNFKFKYTISELRKYKFEAGIKVRVSEESINYLNFKKEKGTLSFKIEYKKAELPDNFFDFVPKKLFESNLIEEKKTLLIHVIIQMLLDHKHNTFFLPASRSFFPVFYSYIYDIERKEREQNLNNILNLVEANKTQNKIKLSEIRKLNIFRRSYTEPMNEVFEKLYSLNHEVEATNEEFYLNLVEKLEIILGGKITQKNQEGVALTEFNLTLDNKKLNLPMYLSSSSVNQLTLLYLYFKYWAEEKNNFLMIDEPEENLHPENQINLLNILIKFVSERDNKVLITTHSSILANAINNYIYLDALKNEYKVDVKKIIEKHKLKYVDTDVSIAEEKVGVYFFTGDKIIDYVSDDYGIYFRNFREVENNLDKSLRILTDYIYTQEDECEDE